MCVSNLPRVAFDSEAAGIRTRDLLIASPAPYHYATPTNNGAGLMSISYFFASSVTKVMEAIK